MKKNKKEKVEYAPDDGRTLYSMDALNDRRIRPKNQIDLTKKERRALFQAMVKKLAPMLLCIIIGFSLCFLILFLWLK